MNKMIAHNKTTITEDDSFRLTEVLDSGWLSEGREVASFEQDFCELYNLPKGSAIAVSSGSAAIFLALQALQAKGKTVAIPIYGCSSLENAVQLAQAKPIYIDTRKRGFNMKQSALSMVDIAIYPHLFGIPSLIKKIQTKIIEDCAQSIGSTVNGELVGLQGEIGVFSFYATKLMTSAGQGGMIISKSQKYIDFIRDFIHFDCKTDGMLRFNFQMTDIQASMGRVQLKQLFSQFIPKREKIYQLYKKSGLPFYDGSDKNIQPVRFRALLKTNHPDELSQFLLTKGIKTIVPIEKKEVLGGEKIDKSNAIKQSQSYLSIPCYPLLKTKQVNYILSSLKEGEKLIC